MMTQLAVSPLIPHPSRLGVSVMLRSTLLKTLRDQRWPALGWGGALGLLAVAIAAGWANTYTDAASRQRLAAEVTSGLSFAQVFYGRPINVDQAAGWVQWRSLGVYPLMLGLFIVIAATGATRGAEERGQLDVVLTTSRSRGRLFAEQAAGLGLALLVAATLIWAGVVLSGPAAGAGMLSPGRAALSVLNLALAAGLFGAVALLAGQFVQTRRAAATIAGLLLFAAHLWSNLGLVAEGLGGARWLSPLYLYSRGHPLADGHTDVPALVLLALLTAGCATLAGRLFVQRDIGATARLPLPAFLPRWSPSRRPSSTFLLGNGLQRGLRGGLGSAVVWGLSLSAYAALVTGIAPSVRRSLEQEPAARDFLDRLGRGGIDTDAGFLAVGLFSLLPAMVAIFATTLASSRAAEEREGRLELELTYPPSRVRTFVERALAAGLTATVAVAFAGAAFLITARLAGVNLDWGRAVVSVLLLVPLATVVTMLGYAVAAWRPGVTTGVVSIVVAVSYFADLLAPLLSLPEAVQNASIFHLYGTPLLEDAGIANVMALIALAGAFLLAGAAMFARRDIEQ